MKEGEPSIGMFNVPPSPIHLLKTAQASLLQTSPDPQCLLPATSVKSRPGGGMVGVVLPH